MGYNEGTNAQPEVLMYGHPSAAFRHTSQSAPLRVDQVELFPGAIGVTMCPGQKGLSSTKQTEWDRDMEVDVAQIAAWGARHVVSALDPKEFGDLRVSNLPSIVEASGAQWHHAPIAPGEAPDGRFGLAWSDLRVALVAAIKKGEKVVVHSRHGEDRAGLIAAALIKELHPERPLALVVEQVRRGREGALRNPVHIRWLEGFYPDTARTTAATFSNPVEEYVRMTHDYRSLIAQAPKTRSAQEENQILDDMGILWDSLGEAQRQQARDLLEVVPLAPKRTRTISP